MRSRSRKTSGAFSLFAFQDIITSVTGIVIVMMMVLTLQLIDRPKPKENTTQQTFERLHAMVENSQERIEELKRTTRQQEVLIREVAKTTTPELKQEIANRSQHLIEIEQTIESIEQEQTALETLLKQVEIREYELKPTLAEIQELERRVAKLKSELDRMQHESRIAFSVPRGYEQTGWIAVVEDEHILLAQFNVTAAPLRFRRQKQALSSQSAAAEFGDWISTHRSEIEYVLLVVRPAGISQFDDLVQRLNHLGVKYGYDLVGEDEQVLDPAKGAAR